MLGEVTINIEGAQGKDTSFWHRVRDPYSIQRMHVMQIEQVSSSNPTSPGFPAA